MVADIQEFSTKETFHVVLLDRVLHMLPLRSRMDVLLKASRRVRRFGHLLIADEPRNAPTIRGHLSKTSLWTMGYSKKGFLFAQKRRPT
jgi:hypothetical protein